MATILITITVLCEKYHISESQFDKATHCTMGNEHFYIVESASEPKEYHVKYNRQFGKLTCTCKAGQQGTPCWHERAALAAEEHYKAQRQQERLNEQATIEATEEYQLDQFSQLFVELEAALDALDAIAARSA